MDAHDLATSMMILNRTWRMTLRDISTSDVFWSRVFRRDFLEDGHRFNAPCGLTWFQYYYQHRLTRPFERMKLLQSTHRDRKYIIVQSHLYDVTDFLYDHPGGHHVISDVIGTDATTAWLDFEHSQGAQAYMTHLLVPDETTAHHLKQWRGTMASIVLARKSLWQRTLAHVHSYFVMDGHNVCVTY
jgi:cytochrome b involved in lipid metabolism